MDNLTRTKAAMKRTFTSLLAAATAFLALPLNPVRAQAPAPPPAGDSVIVRIQNTDLRTAVQVMGQYLDRPIVFSGTAQTQVTFETPRPVPRSDIVRMLRGLLESQNFELVDDSASHL